MKDIAEKISSIRISKGIPKVDIARACGITQTAYANIEKGETKSISIEVGRGIANALGISFNELFEIELPSGNNELIHKLQEEIQNLKKQIDDKSLLIDLLLKEKEIFKRTAIISVVEYSDSIINEIDERMKETSTNSAKEKLEFQRDFVVSYKQAILDRFVNYGYFEQIDIDKFYKDLNEHYIKMGDYGYSRLGIKTNFKE